MNISTSNCTLIVNSPYIVLYPYHAYYETQSQQGRKKERKKKKKREVAYFLVIPEQRPIVNEASRASGVQPCDDECKTSNANVFSQLGQTPWA